MNLLRDLNSAIRKKLVDSAASDVASGVYSKAKEAVLPVAQRVAEEARDERNHARAREAVQNFGQGVRHIGQEALHTLGLAEQPRREPPSDPKEDQESLRERLRREMSEG